MLINGYSGKNGLAEVTEYAKKLTEKFAAP
jgi:hypothetical protein